MSDTLSISQRHLAWQHWLLSQMQITPWIPQNQPTKPYQLADIFTENTEHLSIQTNSSINTEIAPLDDEPLENFNFDQMFYGDVDVLTDTAVPSPPQKTQTILLETVEPFTLQTIIANHWILLVDTQYLQDDVDSQQLWINIANAFSQQPHILHFPLVTNFDKLDKHLQQQMSHSHLAVASFQGFIAHLKQQQAYALSLPIAQLQLGSLTPLPLCLSSQNIQSLPTLSAMLQNTVEKRLLWQTLTQSNTEFSKLL